KGWPKPPLFPTVFIRGLSSGTMFCSSFVLSMRLCVPVLVCQYSSFSSKNDNLVQLRDVITKRRGGHYVGLFVVGQTLPGFSTNHMDTSIFFLSIVDFS